MFSPAVEAWLEGRCTPGMKAHLKSDRPQIEQWIQVLGIEGTALADMYLRFGPSCVGGWYAINEIDQIQDWTRYATDALTVADGYLALTSVEGQGITLYHLASQAVFDVEFGQFEAFASGRLAPVAMSFAGFLELCRLQQVAQQQDG